MKKELKIWGIAAGTIAMVSVLLPWINAMGTSVSLVSADGGSDGLILLGTAALFVVTLFIWPHTIWTRVAAAINAALGIYEAINVHMVITDAKAEAGGFGALVSVGFGAYLCLLASAALLAWAGYLTYLDIQRKRGERVRLYDGTWMKERDIPKDDGSEGGFATGQAR